MSGLTIYCVIVQLNAFEKNTMRKTTWIYSCYARSRHHPLSLLLGVGGHVSHLHQKQPRPADSHKTQRYQNCGLLCMKKYH